MVDSWCDVGQVFQIKDRVKNQVFGTKDLDFVGLTVGEKKGEKERNPSLLLAILGAPSSQELKFIYSTRATRTYQEREISLKIQRNRFEEIKGFGLRRCS